VSSCPEERDFREVEEEEYIEESVQKADVSKASDNRHPRPRRIIEVKNTEKSPYRA
jgi:hypothetical protein